MRRRRASSPARVAPAARTARLVGLGLMALGVVLTHDLFADPVSRIGPGWLGLTIFAGPVALVVGAFQVVQPRAGARESTSVSAGSIGVALLAILAAVFVYSLVTRSSVAGFVVSILIFVLGLPGLALVLLDVRRQRRDDRQP